jgi:hypothetical protein
VRVECTERGTQWGYSLWDLKVIGQSTADNLAATRVTTVALSLPGRARQHRLRRP